MRLAFLGGLAVVLLLVPINKWLAKRIEAATNTKMTFKDLRVKRTGELLRGIHQIKAAAWEPAFVAHVRVLLSQTVIGVMLLCYFSPVA